MFLGNFVNHVFIVYYAQLSKLKPSVGNLNNSFPRQLPKTVSQDTGAAIRARGRAGTTRALSGATAARRRQRPSGGENANRASEAAFQLRFRPGVLARDEARAMEEGQGVLR